MDLPSPLTFNDSKSLRWAFGSLRGQLDVVRPHTERSALVGRLTYHLVGSLLELILGRGGIERRPYEKGQSDSYMIGETELIVSAPFDPAVFARCEQVRSAGWVPLLMTDVVDLASAWRAAREYGIEQELDITDVMTQAAQFSIINSDFTLRGRRRLLRDLFLRYNETAIKLEGDHRLYVELIGGPP